ncbi:DNA polymerase III subunit delta' [Streptococcus sp. sy010]|uniref:DNA polymerase III subunit delta' n=1 Tax=Streptococcus sp. sy010 TaxID=2600148 RepID=UPI0011B5E352|nr:DNA polymerase III subunit delta' [Streptococcus sp. sy010]TWT14216.1 DNA polymerase III subunit delta' [Streptococcus sp. sy010]
MTVAQLQPKIYRDFVRILQTNRLSHAYLFDGQFASLEMALFLTQSQFCADLVDRLPCGKCRSCRLIVRQEFPDLHVIEPTGQLIKTETIRELLHDFSRSGFESDKQVFIIRQAEKMHPNAANSLLKIMEEPRGQSIIFLLTDEANLVLTTIKSRCQQVFFPKNDSYLREFLNREGLLPNQAKVLAQVAQNQEEAMFLAKSQKVLQQLQHLERFLGMLFRDQKMSFLEVAHLATIFKEKSEQELAFKLLSFLLAEQLPKELALFYLERLYVAQKMWKSHVSFQNVLEYMVIS